MAEMADSVSGSNSGSSSILPKIQEIGIAGSSPYNSFSFPSSTLMEFPSYESLAAKSQITPSNTVSLGVRTGESNEEAGADGFQIAGWNDPVACQLEELLSLNLYENYQCVIRKIAAFGYSEELAEKALLSIGLNSGGKDFGSNVVDHTLGLLRKGKEIDTSRGCIFKDLQHLVGYTLLEMICVLRAVKPFLTVGDAMWCLLICDMNILHACAPEGNFPSYYNGEEILGETSSSAFPQLNPEGQSSQSVHPNISKASFPKTQNFQFESLKFGSFPNLYNTRLPHLYDGLDQGKESLVSASDTMEKNCGAMGDFFRITSQHAAEENLEAGKLSSTSKNRSELKTQQKWFPLEKNCWAFSGGRLSSSGFLVVEKRIKPPGNPPVKHMKKASSQMCMAVGADGRHHFCTPPDLPSSDVLAALPTKDTICTLPAKNTKSSVLFPPEKNTTSKLECGILETSKTPDYYARIPYDKSLRKYIPQDKNDEVILKLVPWLQALQKELHGWNEWANQKVMQAAHRLRRDQYELKTMRQEKEETKQDKKDQQTLEENAIRRLSEMELALRNASGQVESANTALRKLEVENTVLNKEMEGAKLWAAESAASCQKATEREQKALKKAQTWETQKGLLQEELVTEKCKVTRLQKEVEEAKTLLNQIEVLSIRKEREQLEALMKTEEDLIKQQAKNDMQKYMEEIKRLENKLSLLRLKRESSRMVAFQGATGGGYANFLTKRNAQGPKGNQTPAMFNRAVGFVDSMGTRGVRRERECVMCLSEEMSVVFLPCAHQVVCAKCNELHEKQGMKDCPSCRTPIQQRINASYARISGRGIG
ncbi:putative E3 ubiquitin-protein ligase RF298 isoform X2 [Malania oleifera]|uniref:putative E3 ubiquitin-protein ligase RF298 isoform X2 n=1 Tax=Malania oleifera TaxID=397392 RepID=UPI0025AEC6E0|nr:putative E3 ubiquitin-protein ligase RF298 isoform X2 [Malania oleifera]